jgi:hypothetical protein
VNTFQFSLRREQNNRQPILTHPVSADTESVKLGIALRLVLFALVFTRMGAVGALAQSRSATGQLQVTAVVVSSSQLIEQPDGTFRLIVANAPSQADAQDLMQAIGRLSEDKHGLSASVPQAVKPQAALKRRKAR